MMEDSLVTRAVPEEDQAMVEDSKLLKLKLFLKRTKQWWRTLNY